jgi:predicted kinase
MGGQTLFLMLGYPGAGKTTAALEIHKLTGAVHLWADHIRRERFEEPTYTHQENIELYSHLNELTAELLAAGNSVIFDTNFNFYKDRQHLRQIARDHGARSIVIWVTTPKEVAKDRATKNAHSQDTRVLGDMPVEAFERMSRNLQPPQSDEPTIELDGTKITAAYIKEKLEGYLV